MLRADQNPEFLAMAHVILATVAKMSVEEIAAIESDGARAVMRGMAGNSVSRIATIAQNRGSRLEDDPENFAIFRPIRAISAALGEPPDMSRVPPNAVQLLEKAGWPVNVAEATVDLAVVVNDLGSSVGALMQDSPESAWFSALSALCAAFVGEEAQVPARLFNVGSALGRSPKSVGGKDSPAKAASLRGLMNAMALWWAIEFSDGTPDDALDARDGLDCAVNLAGALVQVIGQDTTSDLAAAVGPLLASLRPLTSRANDEALRLQASMDTLQRRGLLREAQDNQTRLDLESIAIESREIVRALLHHLGDDGIGLGDTEVNESPRDREEWLADTIARGFDLVFGPLTDEKAEPDGVYPYAARTASLRARPLAEIVKQYTSDASVKQLPAVRAGVMKEREFSAIVPNSRNAPANLAPVIRDFAQQLSMRLRR
ncbi:MAG: hypothetical protein ABL953_03145 [Ilumatobacteraceae bacterium]